MFAEADTGGARATARRCAWLALLVAGLTLSLGLLGCGDDDSTTDGGPDGQEFSPQVVTSDDIEAQEAGSPGRALLEWWQAFQFQDAVTVLGLTSENTIDELGKKNLQELVETRGQGLQGIEILGATESGDTASVRAGLLTFQPEEEGAPPPDEPTASRPITFTMEGDGDQWLFDSPTYLQPMIDGMLQAEEQADQQQGDDNNG